MANDQATLSEQDVQDLQDLKSKLPPDHPGHAKIDALMTTPDALTVQTNMAAKGAGESTRSKPPITPEPMGKAGAFNPLETMGEYRLSHPNESAQQAKESASSMALPMTVMGGLSTSPIKTIAAKGLVGYAAPLARGAVKSAVGSEALGYLGDKFGKTAGDVGRVVGAVGGPFVGNGMFAKLPFGLGRTVMSTEELAAERAAQKVAQREADIAAGLRKAPGTETIGNPAERGGIRRIGNEGRPATWTNEKVMSEIRHGGSGIREAVPQANRRGLDIPSEYNSQFVMGSPSLEEAARNPIATTELTPGSVPIKQGGKVRLYGESTSSPRLQGEYEQRLGTIGKGGSIVPGPKPVGLTPQSETPLSRTAPGGGYTGPERRATALNSSSPDPIREARFGQLRKALQDPTLTARDRDIIQSQLQDMISNPGERNELGHDINKYKAEPKKLTREEAEANQAEREEGRKQRFNKGK